ncbi:MAG: hypothetical protein PEPC_01761 [Peptostreptococcus russellii]
MNQVECEVTEVLSPPYEEQGCWCVDVKYISWGHTSEGTVYKLTREEINKVEVGSVFLA